MSGSWNPREFPNLNPKNHRITSELTDRYNCIAWVVDSINKWWWPKYKGYWPSGVPREETLSAFLAAFATCGYEECEDGTLERGYEKIAIYSLLDVGINSLPTHAAKQLQDGRWTSKLGPYEDIVHDKLEDVGGPDSLYGIPIRFMKRAIASK